jgi:UDPglucose--hexose-1-phosphate uridylyltransferase
MKGNHIRQNKITKQWVIYAPTRRGRPKDAERASAEKADLPSREESCPFCPGNEHLLPSILMEDPPDPLSWQVRVVPNKFPVATPQGDQERISTGIYLFMGAYGHHEVVIESPLHNRHPGQMSLDEMARVVEAYHARYRDLMEKDENMMILIFRNHGVRAGTSLAHPHSQIIATGMVPHYIRWQEEGAQHYFDEWGRCVYCDILEYESREGRRVVYENDSFVAFIPFAADVPYEIWIVPRRHRADFGDVSDKEKGDLAASMQEVLGRLHVRLGNPDYNYIIMTSARYRAGEPQLHWYLQIRPRLTTTAGFEIGSGISINPSIPEEDTQELRK